MAKMRNVVAGKFSGNAGSFRFNQTAGRSIVGERVYTNKSKGNGASYTQRLQRCKIANIANAFALFRPFLVKAFEGKKTNQSWYNVFASLNLGKTPFLLTKEVAESGAFLAQGMQISKGSLTPIKSSWEEGKWCPAVRVSGSLSLTDNTVAEWSADIIANNSNFKFGDQILWINVIDYSRHNMLQVGRGVVEYFELTLSNTDTRKFNELPNPGHMTMSVVEEEFLAPASVYCAAVVHTRRVNGILRVSPAFLETDTNGATGYEEYLTTAWIEKCAASYGYQDAALLDPNL